MLNSLNMHSLVDASIKTNPLIWLRVLISGLVIWVFSVLPTVRAGDVESDRNLSIPETQNAVVQTGNGGPQTLRVERVPVLKPGEEQVLIKVSAAAVNPIDWKLREGYRGANKALVGTSSSAPERRIPGFDLAGTVVQLGSKIDTVNPGDQVFAMLGRIQIEGLNGAYAEYAVAPAENVMKIPSGVSPAQAAGMATVGLTAARLLDPLIIENGDRVFINGVAGGVGSSVAQMAMALGATVIGTASAKHHEYLNSIDVHQVVDYTKVDFVDVVAPVDVYVETVNQEIATRAMRIMKPGGALVSSVGLPAPEVCEAARINCVELHGTAAVGKHRPSTEAELLNKVRILAAQGLYRVHVDKTFPLAEAAQAQEYNRQGRTTGKVVILID